MIRLEDSPTWAAVLPVPPVATSDDRISYHKRLGARNRAPAAPIPARFHDAFYGPTKLGSRRQNLDRRLGCATASAYNRAGIANAA